MNRQKFINQNRSYPVSTGVLNFVQEQLETIYGSVLVAGKNYILKTPTAGVDGLIVIAGELMPLKYSAVAYPYIEIVEEAATIIAQNIHYVDVQVVRFAKYRSDSIGAVIRVIDLETFISLNETSKTLNSTATQLGVTTQRVGAVESTLAGVTPRLQTVEELVAGSSVHAMPKGAIIMWSGSQVPAGFGICNGTTYNGVKSPDLRGRFIIGSAGKYDINDKGGSEAATLEERHLPSHSHGLGADYKFVTSSSGPTNGGGGDSNRNCLKNGTVKMEPATGSAGGGVAHENMPPYYALAFIIKYI